MSFSYRTDRPYTSDVIDPIIPPSSVEYGIILADSVTGPDSLIIPWEIAPELLVLHMKMVLRVL